MSKYVPVNTPTRQPRQGFFHEQAQINNLTNQGFAYWSDEPGLATSFVDAVDLPLGKLAQEFTMADNCFQSSYGGSFLASHFAMSGKAPTWNLTARAVPANTVKTTNYTDDTSLKLTAGRITGDLRIVEPFVSDQFRRSWTFSGGTPDPNLAPPFTSTTIGDKLSAAGVKWAFYAQEWNNAQTDQQSANWVPTDLPYLYYKTFHPNITGGLYSTQLKDLTDFVTAVGVPKGTTGGLPEVSFLRMNSLNNEKPDVAPIVDSQVFTANLVNSVRASTYWNTSAIFIIYDSNGGRWDHVSPPKAKDAYGPGVRVPLIIVSPYAKRGYVDNTPYESLSLTRLLETKYNLTTLSTRVAAASVPMSAFSFPISPSATASVTPSATPVSASVSVSVTQTPVIVQLATPTPNEVGLGVGIGIGLGVPIVVCVIITALVCCRCCSKVPQYRPGAAFGVGDDLFPRSGDYTYDDEMVYSGEEGSGSEGSASGSAENTYGSDSLSYDYGASGY